MIREESVGVLLPVRGRHWFLPRTLLGLRNSYGVEKMELVIVVDNDVKAFQMCNEILREDSKFQKVTILYSKERIYSVAAFNLAFDNCESSNFIWVSNSLSYDSNWFISVVNHFNLVFSDNMGVLAIGGKVNKANFGMTSKKFIEHNEDEWFNSGYKINFCDDELACRAILLGRYEILFNSGIIINKDVINEDLLHDSFEEKLRMKKIDRGLFYKRSEINFGLDPKKLYSWKGFRRINEKIKL